MTSIFKLTFSTNLGKQLNISIPDADKNIKSEEIKKVMDEIISTNAVKSQKVGSPIKKLGAKLENTQTDYIEFK